MILLRTIAGIQLAFILAAAAYFLLVPTDIYTALLVFFGLPACALIAIYAGYQSYRHADRRGLGLATIATPVIGFTLPFVITGAYGGPLPPLPVVLIAMMAAALGAAALLAKRGGWMAQGRFVKPGLNQGLAIAMLALLALLWLPMIGIVATAGNITLPLAGSVSDTNLRLGAAYFGTVSALGLATGLFGVVFAPVGLLRNPGGRLLHAVQLVLTLLLFATVGIVVVTAWLFMLNPG
jgi:hypothetical protein